MVGKTSSAVKPNEFAIDIGYSRKLFKNLSAALAFRYIQSNLLSGIQVAGINSTIGKSQAADVSLFYQKSDLVISEKKCVFALGLNISNIGQKISYLGGQKNFLPTNLRLGSSLSSSIDEYNKVSLTAEINKLMVPSPPKYKFDSNGFPEKDLDGNYVIISGKDPNRNLVSGMIGSFYDAPGGFNEELKEITSSIGLEYIYTEQFIVRLGYFNEAMAKGNRKNVTMGIGVKYKRIGINFSNLIPIQRVNSLTNTFRITLVFEL